MTPPKLTEAQIRRFWELCGWRPELQADMSSSGQTGIAWWHSPSCAENCCDYPRHKLTPPDPSNLNAVFEALLYRARELQTNFQFSSHGDSRYFTFYLGDLNAAYGGSGGLRDITDPCEAIIL